MPQDRLPPTQPPATHEAGSNPALVATTPAPGPAQAAMTPWQGPDQPGTVVGHYRLLRLLGAGGMGTVWLAERDDGQFRQQVALKLVNPSAARAGLQARFMQERQILARLQHPNIAALHDGGVSADGRPYFALEFVEGRAITEYCDEHGLDVRDRVRLFLQVLRAVAHAHQRLIVHRDIKPSNVLVTNERVVKLLDFGIAKLLAQPDSGVQTQHGERAMTPRYAAPEQVRGDPVTVGTDVYALGMTLFEMLTGRMPYHVPSGSVRAIEEAILTQEPCRPAQALQPGPEDLFLDPSRERYERGVDRARLRRELRGDIEQIVLKALRKESEQRYASAEAFAADLERYLDQRPVLARPPSFGYHLRKWLHRHALGAGLATAALLTLVTGLFVLNSERERANAAAQRAEATQDFLVGLFEEAGPDSGASATASLREILARGAARIERDLGREEVLKQRLTGLIGRLMNDVGDFARAEAVLSRALEGLEGRAPADPERLALRIQLGEAYHHTGRHEESETAWKTVLADSAPDSIERAAAHSGLGELYTVTNRFELAHAEHAEAIRILRAQGPAMSEGLAAALVRAGYALDYHDRSDEAETLLTEAVAILRARQPAPPGPLARAIYQLGMVQRTLGQLEPARGSLEEAVGLMRGNLGADHLETLDTRRLLGDVLDELGERDAALRELRAVQRDAERRYGEDAKVSVEVANSIASIDLVESRYGEAERGFRRAAKGLEAEFGPLHLQTAVVLANLSIALFEQGRLDEADAVLQRSLKAELAVAGPESSNYGLSLLALARIERFRGRLPEAQEHLREADRILTTVYGEAHSQTLRARLGLALVTLDRAELDRTDAALDAAADLLAHVEKHVTTDSRRGRLLRAELLVGWGRIEAQRGEPAQAEPRLREALAIARSEYPQGHRLVAETALELAAVQRQRQDLRASRESLATAEAANPAAQPLSPHAQALRRRLGLR